MVVRGVQETKQNNNNTRKKGAVAFITDECVRSKTSRFLDHGPPATPEKLNKK